MYPFWRSSRAVRSSYLLCYLLYGNAWMLLWVQLSTLGVVLVKSQHYRYKYTNTQYNIASMLKNLKHGFEKINYLVRIVWVGATVKPVESLQKGSYSSGISNLGSLQNRLICLSRHVIRPRRVTLYNCIWQVRTRM